jgi:hypothetical protein
MGLTRKHPVSVQSLSRAEEEGVAEEGVAEAEAAVVEVVVEASPH